MNSYLKKFLDNRKYGIDVLVLALYNFSVTFIEKFNLGYKRMNKLILKENIKKREYETAFKMDVNSELKQIKDDFKLIETQKVNNRPKNLEQLYLAEYVHKNSVIDQSANQFIVSNPNTQQKFVVDFVNEKYICHCNMKSNCCHIKAVQLKVNGKTSAEPFDIDLTNKKTKKKSGLKSGDEVKRKCKRPLNFFC